MMKHVPSEKYSLAWFKLAECVARGERERALGVYKLLSHSIDDQAFALQLEGDLLLSFQDKDAAIKYEKAAQLYKKAQRFVEAAAVYEHLIELQPDVDSHVVRLVSLYEILNFSEKISEHVKDAVERFLHSQNRTKLNMFLTKLQDVSKEGYDLACRFVKEG